MSENLHTNSNRKEWKLVYQKTPFNFNNPATLVIESPDIEGALAIAYDHLTRKGFAVAGLNFEFDKSQIDFVKLYTLLGLSPNLGLGYFGEGNTQIRSCTPFAVTVTGKVRGG